VADFMVGVSELDDDDDEVMSLKTNLQRSMEELKSMLKEEAALRNNAEMRLEERCNHMDQSLVALTSVRERLDALERGLIEIEAIKRDVGFMIQDDQKGLANLKTLAMEFERQSKAQQDHAAAVVSLQDAVANLGNSADVTSMALGNMGKKIAACAGQCATVDDHCVQLVQKAAELERRMDTHGNNTGADVNAIRNSNESFKAEIQQRNDANLRNINKLLTDSLAPMHARIETCAHGIGEHKDSMMAVQRDLQRELQNTCDGQFGALQKKLTDDHARLSRDLGDQLNSTHGRWQQASEDISVNIQRLERGLNNCESRLVSFDERQGDLLPNIQRLERGLNNCEGRLVSFDERLQGDLLPNIQQLERGLSNCEGRLISFDDRVQGASKNTDGKISQLMANDQEINARVDQYIRANQNLEGVLREVAAAADKTRRGLEATGPQLQQLQGRVLQCEKNGQSLEEQSVNQVNATSALERKMGELSTQLKQQFQQSTEECEQLFNSLEAIQRSWGNAGFCDMIKRKPRLSAALLINEMDGTMGATMGTTMGTTMSTQMGSSTMSSRRVLT